MNEYERTINILSNKLAQAEVNHSYTSALLEAVQMREQALQTRVAELEGQLSEAKAALEAAMGLPPSGHSEQSKNQA